MGRWPSPRRHAQFLGRRNVQWHDDGERDGEHQLWFVHRGGQFDDQFASGGTGDLEVSGNGTLSLGGSLSTNIVTIAGGMLTGSGTIASGTQTTWSSGEVDGSLTNAGTLTVSGSILVLAGTLTNTGTIDVAGTDTIYAAASGAMIPTIRRGAPSTSRSDGSLSTSGYGGTAFNNSGTLEKTAGSGTTTVNFPLDNTGGTVAITSTGTLNFSGGGDVQWHDDGERDGEHQLWYVHRGGQFDDQFAERRNRRLGGQRQRNAFTRAAHSQPTL